MLYLERTGGIFGWRAAERWRRTGVRIWNWGITGLVVAGGTIALMVAAVMGLSGTTFSC